MQDSTRNMEYYHLSDCANLEFYFHADSSTEGRIMLKFTEEDQLWFERQNPPPYADSTDNGNEPMEVIPFQINWVKCPHCGWRFRLDYATHPVWSKAQNQGNLKAKQRS